MSVLPLHHNVGFSLFPLPIWTRYQARASKYSCSPTHSNLNSKCVREHSSKRNTNSDELHATTTWSLLSQYFFQKGKKSQPGKCWCLEPWQILKPKSHSLHPSSTHSSLLTHLLASWQEGIRGLRSLTPYIRCRLHRKYEICGNWQACGFMPLPWSSWCKCQWRARPLPPMYCWRWNLPPQGMASLLQGFGVPHV